MPPPYSIHTRSPNPAARPSSPLPGTAALASITIGSSSGGQITTKHDPPGAMMPGSVVIAVIVAATAASTALPPLSAIAAPASAAR